MDIDFVIPWVDGSDPVWRAEMERYAPVKKNDACSANRYRDWGLLRYWFRSIEKFAPWVRSVHFVTWGHLPEFLNVEHPKLHIVNHRDYIPHEYLPTFNANVIEMNMHRIEGLAEHFVYFNDDMFLLKPLSPWDVFDRKNGLPRAQASERPIVFISDETWEYLVCNDMYIINRHFPKLHALACNFSKFVNWRYPLGDNARSLALGCISPRKFCGFRNFHCLTAYQKSTYEEIWEKEPELLAGTSGHKFRAKEDVNQWLALWWQIASGRFSPKRESSRVFKPTKNNIFRFEEIVMSGRHASICIHDVSEDVDYMNFAKKIAETFEKLLPERSSFEKR